MYSACVFQFIRYFIVQCFELRHVHRVGIFRARCDACNLAGFAVRRITYRYSTRARLPCAFELRFFCHSLHEVAVTLNPCIQCLFRLCFFRRFARCVLIGLYQSVVLIFQRVDDCFELIVFLFLARGFDGLFQCRTVCGKGIAYLARLNVGNGIRPQCDAAVRGRRSRRTECRAVQCTCLGKCTQCRTVFTAAICFHADGHRTFSGCIRLYPHRNGHITGRLRYISHCGGIRSVNCRTCTERNGIFAFCIRAGTDRNRLLSFDRRLCTDRDAFHVRNHVAARIFNPAVNRRTAFFLFNIEMTLVFGDIFLCQLIGEAFLVKLIRQHRRTGVLQFLKCFFRNRGFADFRLHTDSDRSAAIGARTFTARKGAVTIGMRHITDCR